MPLFDGKILIVITMVKINKLEYPLWLFHLYTFYKNFKTIPSLSLSVSVSVVSFMTLKVKVAQSCPTLWDTIDYIPWNSAGHNAGVGHWSLLQGISLPQGMNSGLQHCRQILYHLNDQRSSIILEWVTYPFSSRSSWPGNQTVVSCIEGWFFISWAIY